MTDREKLIELIGKVQDEGRDYSDVVCVYRTSNEHLADYLLDNDVVPVVRCKNCTSYNTKGCAAGFGWCVAWDQGRMDDNFCHCGERKNNG